MTYNAAGYWAGDYDPEYDEPEDVAEPPVYDELYELDEQPWEWSHDESAYYEPEPEEEPQE